MSSLNRSVKADTLRSITYDNISESYQSFGDALTENWIIMSIKNTTDKTVYLSEDGTSDHYELPAGNSESYDFQSNSTGNNFRQKKVNLQFRIRGEVGDLPTSGKVILQGQYV